MLGKLRSGEALTDKDRVIHERGLVRWLRPGFQAPEGAREIAPEQAALDIAAKAAPVAAKKQAWPREIAAQVTALRHALAAHGTAATPRDLARSFKGARADRVEDLLETLAALGQARDLGQGRYVA